MILSALRPLLCIPHGLSTLYRCLLTTVAQSKPYHEKPFDQGLLQPQGALYPIQTIINHSSRTSSSSFIRISTRQLAVSSLSKGILSTLNFTRALDLTGRGLETSRTESENRIDWANLTARGSAYDVDYRNREPFSIWFDLGYGPTHVAIMPNDIVVQKSSEWPTLKIISGFQNILVWIQCYCTLWRMAKCLQLSRLQTFSYSGCIVSARYENNVGFS